jgi:serine/threonine protein kinase
MAPEIHACYRANLNQDQIEPYEADSADVFALGVVLFAMVMGTLPF